jgi:hypothetical protein
MAEYVERFVRWVFSKHLKALSSCTRVEYEQVEILLLVDFDADYCTTVTLKPFIY